VDIPALIDPGTMTLEHERNERPSRGTVAGKVRGIVFGDRPSNSSPAARYLAGRTIRALARSDVEAEDAGDLASADLAARLEAIDAPVWFVRAGAWPAARGKIGALPPSATGLPLCAVSGVVGERSGAPIDDECRAWEAWQRQTGGAVFPGVVAAKPDGATGLGPTDDGREAAPLPRLAGVYVERRVLESLRVRLLGGEPLVEALAAELREPGRRIVRPTTFDLYFDPHLRVAQVVTSLQRGGAERVTLDLHEMLPELGIRSCVVVLGSPTREAFATPTGTIDVSRAGERVAAAAPAVQDFAADLVHGHLLGRDVVRELAAGGIPMLQTVHNLRPGWPAGLAELASSDATLLVACSQAVERDLAAAGVRIATRTVWNGIDFAPLKRTAGMVAAAARLRNERGIGCEDFVLLALANPRPQKRLERLPAIVAATQAEL
jgi:hypothetical protein